MKNPATRTRPSGTVRCAIYTRKSSEEGLEQEFNSLQAQREACEAFINSQRHEGWVCLRTAYDDGGFSGATIDRPALQQLLADITAGRGDTVVVYKIDRLTRSLADFAKIVEIRIPPLLKLTMPHAGRRQHDPQCRPAAHPGKPVGLAGPDRLGVDQVVWYGGAIMALCWPATPSEVKFAADLYGAFPVKRLFLGFAASSLFGAGKAVLRPVACDQVRGARGRGQGTEKIGRLGGLPPSGACVSQRLDA